MTQARRITFLLSLILLVGAAAESSPGADSLFRMGERSLHEGDLPKAGAYFESYLAHAPGPRLMDVALFKLGEIASARGDYPVALRYYHLLETRFKNSSLLDQAKFKKAYCRFRMGEPRAAIRALNAFLPMVSEPTLRYEGPVLLGDCWRAEGVLEKAVKSYIRALDLSPENQEKTRALILQTIGEEDAPEKLRRLANTGDRAFPYGDALHRALFLAFKQRNYQKFSALGKRFLQRFPDHPGRTWVVEKLADLETNPGLYKTKVGVLLPLSGSAALQGDRILKGIQLAFSSSPLAEAIDLIVKDSAGDPRKARKAMDELTQDPSIIAVLGPAFTRVAEEISPLAGHSGLPMLSPASTFYRSPDRKDVFFFRNSLTGKMEGRAMAEFAVNRLDLKRFAVIYPDGERGEEWKRAFAESIFGMGGEVLTAEKYSEEEVDFTALIRKIGGMDDEELKKEAVRLAEETEGREMPEGGGDRLSVPSLRGGLWNTFDEDQYQPFLKLGYEAIYLPGALKKVRLIIPQLEFFNIVHVKLLGSSGWNSRDLLSLAEGHPGDFFFTDGFNTASGSETTRRFLRDFKTFFGEEPDTLAAQSYDAANILLKLYTSGRRNRTSLRAGLLEMRDFPGVSGRTGFLPSGDAEKELFVLTVRRHRIVDAETGR